MAFKIHYKNLTENRAETFETKNKYYNAAFPVKSKEV